MLVKIDVLLFTDILQKLRCDLLAGNVLVVEDTGSGVSAFFRQVEVVALLIEVDVIVEKLTDDDRRLADHGIDGLSRVLIVAGTKRVLEVVFVILGVLKRRDTALGEIGSAVLESILGDHVNGKIFRKMKCAEKTCGAGADDNDISRSSGIGHITIPLTK